MGDVLRFDDRNADYLGPDALSKSPASSDDSDLLFPALERRMPLQPFLQNVIDVRFAELSVTSQFAMQRWDDSNSLGCHAHVPANQWSCPKQSGYLIYFFWLDVDSQFQIMPEFSPTNLEDRPSLAEMEVFQRHGFDQFGEIELCELEQHVTFCLFVPIPFVINGFVNALGPDLQNVAFTVVIVIISSLRTVNWPTSRDWTRNHGHDLLQAASDLFAHRGLLQVGTGIVA
jgi:hypothetical protein